MIKLFRSESVLSNFSHKGRVYDELEIAWFVVHRESSVVHEEVIKECKKKYDILPNTFENSVFELFTEEEAKALEKYILRTRKQECRIKEVDMGLEIFSWEYGDKDLSNMEGYYRLSNEEGYDLPFVVWGYYSVNSAKDLSWLVNEMEFIERVLGKIEISITNKDRLKSIIEELKNDGFIVDKGVKTKEKIKRLSLYVSR